MMNGRAHNHYFIISHEKSQGLKQEAESKHFNEDRSGSS